METAVIKVQGMTCQGCVRSVTNVLQALPGVTQVQVSLEKSEARVDYDATRVAPGDLCSAVIDAGYEAS